MREIKFRGKRYGDGAWVYGSLYQGIKEGEKYSIILTDSGYHLALPDDRNLAIAFAENEVNVVFTQTVCQFTGQLDKNGKEIYEGDITIEKLRRSRKDGEKLVICFDDFEWQGKNANGSTTSLSLLVEYHTIEVIGNIHDNPELLKIEAL